MMKFFISILFFVLATNYSSAGSKEIIEFKEELSRNETPNGKIKVLDKEPTFPSLDAVKTDVTTLSIAPDKPRIVYWTAAWCVPTCMQDLPNLINLRDITTPKLPISVIFVSYQGKEKTVQDILDIFEKQKSRNGVSNKFDYMMLTDAVSKSPENMVEIHTISVSELGRALRANKDYSAEMVKTFGAGYAPITFLLNENSGIVVQHSEWADWDKDARYRKLLTEFLK